MVPTRERPERAPPIPAKCFSSVSVSSSRALGRKTRSAFFTPILASAFFTRSLRVFYLAQNRGLRRKQVVRCGPPQPPGCGAGLEVWQFAVACVPRATRHGRAIPEHTAPAESACFHGRSAASRPSLATRILPRFLSRSLRVFYSDHRQRVFYAFFTRFFFPRATLEEIQRKSRVRE